jgi:putative endonuclease
VATVPGTKKTVVGALAKPSLSGGTGRRARLKIVCLRACRFDSGLRYLKDGEGHPFFVSDYFTPMASVYILYSAKLGKFYTGSCRDFQFRFQDHLDKVYSGSFTSNSDDWQLFLLLENLSYTQARAIERHIKMMKSKGYIQNLVKYPAIIIKLKEKYADGPCQ